MRANLRILVCFVIGLLFVNTSHSNEECGQRVTGPQSRIVGGEESSPGRWPWQVVFEILTPDGTVRPLCSGTLINSRWVVTAAHCAVRNTEQNIKVVLGVFDYEQSYEGTSNRYSVSEVIIHPDYDTPTAENDIALLQLAGEVEFTNEIAPACLPSAFDDVPVNTSCWITGWGETQNFTLVPFTTLREAEIPVISNALCQEYLDVEGVVILDVHLCAGLSEGGVDTCQGDSGGPLVCQESESSPFFLHGVTSFGFGCARPMSPGVYARVSNFIGWINSTIANTPEEDPFFAIPETPCDAMITMDSMLRLPLDSETQVYAPNFNCTWTLKNEVGDNSSINIEFIERFQVGPGVFGTCNDSVTILDSEGTPISSELCGFSLPFLVTIPYDRAREIQVNFQSDSSFQFDGFAIKVTFGEALEFCGRRIVSQFSPRSNMFKKKPHSKIVGGISSFQGSWPWQAAVEFVDPVSGATPVCGGTLIHRKFVVTSLQCVSSYSPSEVRVILGTTSYQFFDQTRKEFSVSSIQSFTERMGTPEEFGIALIQLAGEVTFNSFILPACLPSQSDDISANASCWVTGWGETQSGFSNQFTSLQEAEISVVSDEICQEQFGSNNTIVSSSQFCAGNGEASLCEGDMGGPLVCQESETSEFVLQGIPSFGFGCALDGSPSVYTQVSQFIDRIDSSLENVVDVDPFFAIPETSCGSMISAAETLRVPLVPETQVTAPNLQCSWTLKNEVGPNSYINIEFVERFHLLDRDACLDSVSILEENGTQIVNNLCGFTLPFPISIPFEEAQEVSVNFTSNRFAPQYEGFAIQVTFGDIPEHFPNCSSSPCSSNGNCTETLYGVECTCDSGYSSNNGLTPCQDINECLPLFPCGLNADCTNSEGNFSCACQPGYVGNGFLCIAAPCGFNATANETAQQFTSPNYPGLYPNSASCEWDFEAAEGLRIYINFESLDLENNFDTLLVFENGVQRLRLTGTLTSSLPAYVSLTNRIIIQFRTDGSVTRTGFSAFFQTIQECDDPNNGTCGMNSDCAILNGNETCICGSGFIQNGNFCADINECALSLDNCDFNADCTNTNGSFICRCRAGYIGNGTTCVTEPCGFNASVTGIPQTISSPGYPMQYENLLRCEWNFVSPEGTFIFIKFLAFVVENNFDNVVVFENNFERARYTGDQNSSLPSYTSQTNMVRIRFTTDGSVTRSGFLAVIQISDGCDFCDDNAFCSNSSGNSTCICNSGYTGNGISCEDLNECAFANPCSANANCFNSEGSFVCRCNSGFTGNGITCFPVSGSCGFNANATATPQLFTSPGHPGQYSNSLNCEWNFESPEGTTIFIEFTAFDLENGFDYVTIFENGSQRERLTGFQNLSLPSYASMTNRVQILFTTDGSVSRTGFSAFFRINTTLSLSCPGATSSSCNRRTLWLCEYIRWRMEFLKEWQLSFQEWRSNYPNALPNFFPICRPLSVSCVNASQLRTEYDSYNCPISYCVDGYYNDLPGGNLQQWVDDQSLWRRAYDAWKEAFQFSSKPTDDTCDY